jgi:hypothetical protein
VTWTTLEPAEGAVSIMLGVRAAETAPADKISEIMARTAATTLAERLLLIFMIVYSS